MTYSNTQTILSLVQDALEKDDLNKAIQILQTLKPADQANKFEDLDNEDQVSLLPKLNTQVTADILENIEDEDAARLDANIPEETAVRIINEMEPDEAVDLQGDIHPQQDQSFLAQLDNPEEIRALLIYPDESAGSLMISEFLALRRLMTVREALKAVRAWKPDKDQLYYLFVVDANSRLCSVVRPQQLIIAEPDALIMDIMDPDVISVKAGMDQEKAADLMLRYNLLALPVVDEQNVLLSIITVDDVMDVVVDEEATEDIQKLGSAQPLNEPYLLTKATSMFEKRVSWLLLLFVTESLTGTVLRYFKAELEAVGAFSFLIPLLIGRGGNAGSQTISSIIHALEVGDMDVRDALKSIWHETRVGLLLGTSIAGVVFIRALIWGSSRLLLIIVALAIFMTVVWANLLGAVLPTLASRLKIDPTMVSRPVMNLSGCYWLI